MPSAIATAYKTKSGNPFQIPNPTAKAKIGKAIASVGRQLPINFRRCRLDSILCVLVTCNLNLNHTGNKRK